ncbi:Hypothetical protein, putative [Bodo saltans]|uniref:Uncharacterized protein n=1 Tax=Bodo saltans TaxID=75058 RepID=A0A0S4JCJ5_BODSA|nr:Hypothetical protein, putative [Bodo saltans]|eukprot:CUG87948.1 Hypothetical protein, putative [Bodo saltans]
MVPEGISSSVPPSYPSGSSVAMFDESLPLWAHCEAEGGQFTSDSPSVAQVPSALGQSVSPSMQHIRPASSSAAMRDSVSSYRTTESSLVGFLRTPPPATPAKGPIEEKIASSPPPDYPASAIPPVVVVVATLPEREERDSYAYHDSHQGTSVPPSFVAANLDGNDIGSYDRLLSPVHVSGRSILDMVAGTSSAKRPPRDSPIRFVPQPVSLLIDASIWGIADDVARGRYMDVIHLAVARLGGAVVNAGVPATLVELCGVGSRDALVSCAASHVVCLVDPGSSIIVDPSAGQCESRIGPTASQSCPRVVGLDWVVSSVERGAWQLGDHEPPVPRDTFVSSTNSFCMMNIVVDLGHSAATSNEGHADALLMRKVQSAIRLAVVGGAAGVWVAWAAPTGQVVAHKVRWEAAAATDDETRRDLFADAASTDSSARGTIILSVGSNVRDAVISSRALLQSFPSHSPTGDDGCGVISNTTSLHLLPVARRSLEWWYRTMQVDGMEEWTRVKASLFDGSMMEWEHQRPRAHTLLYEP